MSKMKIKPLNNRLLIKPQELNETESGIILSTEQDLIIEIADVLEVCDNVKLVKKGDKVLFKSWALDEVRIKDEKLCFLHVDDILGIKE